MNCVKCSQDIRVPSLHWVFPGGYVFEPWWAMQNNSHRPALFGVKREHGNTLATISFLLHVTFNNAPVWFNLRSVTWCLKGGRNEGVWRGHRDSWPWEWRGCGERSRSWQWGRQPRPRKKGTCSRSRSHWPMWTQGTFLTSYPQPTPYLMTHTPSPSWPSLNFINISHPCQDAFLLLPMATIMPQRRADLPPPVCKDRRAERFLFVCLISNRS